MKLIPVFLVLTLSHAALAVTLQCKANETTAVLKDIGVKDNPIKTVAQETFALDFDLQSPDMQIKKAELQSMKSRVIVSYASNVNGAPLSTVEINSLDNYGDVAKEVVKAKSSFESRSAINGSFMLQSLWNEKKNQNNIVVTCTVQ